MVRFIGVAVAGVLFFLLAIAAAGYALYQREPVRLLDGIDRLVGGNGGVEEVRRIRLGPQPTQILRIFRSDATPERDAAVILFVHGGSWDSGHPAHYGFVARSLAREGYVVALAGYRLGPEGRYPGMVEDTAQAIAVLQRMAHEVGGDPDRLFLSGHSAGAYNVVQAVMEPRVLTAAGVDPQAIAGVVGLAGPYDFYPFDGPATRAAFGAAPDGRTTQPVSYVRAGLPPMLLLTGTADTTVRPRNTKALAKRLRQEGSPVATRAYEGLSHSDVLVHLAAPWRGSQPTVRRDILAFLANPMEFVGEGEPSVPVQGENR